MNFTYPSPPRNDSVRSQFNRIRFEILVHPFILFPDVQEPVGLLEADQPVHTGLRRRHLEYPMRL